MRPVGYLINTEGGLQGEAGPFYNYILAGNGLFVRGENGLIKATAMIVPAEVRGLVPMVENVVLPGGKIPRRIFDLALSVMLSSPYRERYLAVVWDDGYHLREPPQEGSESGIKYDRLPNTVVDIHSHGPMGAFFSSTDDRDEQGLAVYIVVGKLNTLHPEVLLRIGVYGHFSHLSLDEVFD